MRRTATLSLLVCIVLAGASVAAWSATDDAMSKGVSLDVQSGTLLRDAVRDLMKAASVNYAVDLDIGDLPCPGIRFVDVPLKTAVANLVKSVGCVYMIDGDILVIGNSVNSPVLRQWKKHIKKLDVTDVDTATALRDLFKDSGINYTIDPAVGGTVSLQLTDVPFATALAKMAQKAGLAYDVNSQGVAEITPVAAAGTQAKMVNLEIKDVALGEALDMLFKTMDLSYTLDPGLSQLKVTAILKDASFQEALKTFCKAAGAVYRIDGKIYVISPRTAIAVAGGGMTGEDVESRIIALHNLKVKDVLYFFTQQGMQVTDLGGGKLTVRGNNPPKNRPLDRAVADLKELDEKSAPTRVVHIKISVAESKPGGKAQVIHDCYLDTEEGIEAQMTVSSAPQRPGLSRPEQMGPIIQATATASISDEGRIGLEINVTYAGGNDANGIIKTQRELESGVPAVLGQFTVQDEDTKEVRTITVTATATLDKSTTQATPGVRPKPAASAKPQGKAGKRVAPTEGVKHK